jgi:hypothetical protein
MFEHRAVFEAQDRESSPSQKRVSFPIVLGAPVMHLSIELNNQHGLLAEEVGEVRTKGLLSTKFRTIEFSST